MHRHQYKGRKLSRETAHRKALLRNLASQVILYEKINTTLPKAKELRPVLEKIITRAKNDSVTNRRVVAKFLSNKDNSLKKLFEELGPLYKDRNGGYVRIVKTGNRKGDNAPMAQIQLLDTEKLTKKEADKKSNKKDSESSLESKNKKTVTASSSKNHKKTTNNKKTPKVKAKKEA